MMSECSATRGGSGTDAAGVFAGAGACGEDTLVRPEGVMIRP
jgi:hypothetical protein